MRVTIIFVIILICFKRNTSFVNTPCKSRLSAHMHVFLSYKDINTQTKLSSKQMQPHGQALISTPSIHATGSTLRFACDPTLQESQCNVNCYQKLPSQSILQYRILFGHTKCSMQQVIFKYERKKCNRFDKLPIIVEISIR